VCIKRIDFFSRTLILAFSAWSTFEITHSPHTSKCNNNVITYSTLEKYVQMPAGKI
jgi:hypothetical protein